MSMKYIAREIPTFLQGCKAAKHHQNSTLVSAVNHLRLKSSIIIIHRIAADGEDDADQDAATSMARTMDL